MSLCCKPKVPVAVIGSSLACNMALAGVLEEVVVTAQKREQNIQDVGIAITAFTGEQTDALGWESTEDVAAQTPGLISASFNGDSSVSFFVVRGIGQADFSDNHEAPTVVYEDGAYIANTGAAAVQLYDTNRIETLKGPQGTLFGRNATGGLVHIINRKPTEEFEAYADLEVAEYSSIRFEGAISGTVTDSMQGRLSVLTHESDGWIDNRIGKDMREQDDLSVRAQLQGRITDRFSAHAVLTYSIVDNISGGTYSPVVLPPVTSYYNGFVPDSDPHKGSIAPGGGLDKEGFNFTATLTYDVGDDIRLTAITNYQDNKKKYTEDSDASPSRDAEFYTDQDARTFGQELRFNGSTDLANWVAGVYYLDLKGDYLSSFVFPDFSAFGRITALGGSNFEQGTRSWAVFGQMDYELAESLAMTIGLRYTHDKKDFDVTGFCASGPNPVTGVALPVITGFGPPWDGLDGCTAFGTSGGTVGPRGTPTITDAGRTVLDKKDDDVTAKIQLDWYVNDETLLYAGFNRGMKAGGYAVSSDGISFLEDLEYDKEVLHAYEVGVKTQLLNKKLRVNAAAYYYDYRDYQAFAFISTSNVVFNRDAEIYGGELEVMAQPMEGLDLIFGLSALDATVEDVPGVGDQKMLLAPELTVNFLARKEWALANGGSVAFQVDGVHVDNHTANSLNSAGAAIASYDVWNARLSYRHTKNWDVALFVRNLTGEEYYTYAFDSSAIFSDRGSQRAYNPPRWAGASIRYTWE